MLRLERGFVVFSSFEQISLFFILPHSQVKIVCKKCSTMTKFFEFFLGKFPLWPHNLKVATFTFSKFPVCCLSLMMSSFAYLFVYTWLKHASKVPVSYAVWLFFPAFFARFSAFFPTLFAAGCRIKWQKPKVWLCRRRFSCVRFDSLILALFSGPSHLGIKSCLSNYIYVDM